MSAANASSEEAVAKILASGTEMTGAEIAAATGLGRSTVGKTLAALERDGTVRRHRGGRDGRRRLPDRWSIGRAAERDDRTPAATQRFAPRAARRARPGLHRLEDTDAVGSTAVAKALGRSAGAVGNCLSRLAAAGRVRQVSDKPRRYTSVTAASSTERRPRKAKS
ncbi:MAG TPA: MarR family transcriptional regulator [Solirubrobacteraceae bacterium]